MGKKTTKTAKAKRTKLGWPEWTLLGIVGCSVILIICALCTGMIKSPQEKAEIELQQIADAYYVEYLYPRLLGDINNDPAPILADYTEGGVPATYLRQLLHYNNDEHADKASVFEKLGCDTNSTGVRFFPQEPYGPRDYTVVYLWQCEEGDFE